jgi:DNA replication and repair protein RecF
LFSIGKSFRTQQDRELINFDETHTRLRVEFDDTVRTNEIEIVIRRDRKKQIKINEVPISKMGDLIGKFCVILFSPDELNLTKGSPNARRKFLDIALSQMSPKYYHILRRYNKVLEQRNNLIKKMRFTTDNSAKETLFVWNEKLAEYGMAIIEYRKKFIDKLYQFSKEIHREISGEEFEIKYKTAFETKDEFKEKLNISIDKEIEHGFTLYGPHRDDLDIYTNGKDLKTYGSQGQHRSAVLALKLAQADMVYEDTGEYPVLLLDDIMSELDSERRSYLVGKVKNKQVIITCTDADETGITDGANLIHIDNGKVV